MSETTSQGGVDYKQIVAAVERMSGDRIENQAFLKREWEAYYGHPDAYSQQDVVQTALVLKANVLLADRPDVRGISEMADFQKFLTGDPGRASFFRYCVREEWKLACEALSKDGVPTPELIEKVSAQTEILAMLF